MYRLPATGLLLVLLAACSQQNSARADMCLAALTGLEEGESGLLLDSIDEADGTISVHYRIAGEESPNVIRCGFNPSSGTDPDLVLITFRGTELGPGRLAYLKSHWLPDEGVEAARRRVLRGQRQEG